MDVEIFSDVDDNFVSLVKLLMFCRQWLLYKSLVQFDVNGIRERFWIFLIRWRWLLTNLDMLLFVAIGWTTIVFDLIPRMGNAVLSVRW